MHASAATRPPAIDNVSIYNETAERAFQILRDKMEGEYGSRLSEDHAECLKSLCYTYARVALGHARGRIAWPLSVGAGKTVSVAAFAAASMDRARTEPFSMMVSQNSIEALCETKRRMIELEVPAEAIGLVHSYKYDPATAEAARNLEPEAAGYASEPSITFEKGDQPEDYPILLISHVRTQQEVFQASTYNGQPRDLVIYCESLIKTEARAQAIKDVEQALGSFTPLITRESHPAAYRAAEYIKFATAQLEGWSEDDPMLLPQQPNSDVLNEWLADLSAIARRSRINIRQQLAILEGFLKVTREPLRVVHLPIGAVIQYELVIPESLKDVVILDASYSIREIIREHDDRMRVVNAYVKVKDFSNVSIDQLAAGGGRSTITRDLKAGSPLLKTIVERIASYPAEKSVLIFTFKHRDTDRRARRKSHADIIRDGLRKAGIDPDEILPNGNPRFCWQTWGREQGFNSWSFCEHVLLVGIYRQSHEQIAGLIAGQRENLAAPEAGCSTTVRRAILSEVFHCLMQATGRARCRHTVDGKASPTQVDWIGLEDFPEDYWRLAMPGIKLGTWGDRVVQQRKTKAAAHEIVRYLERTQFDVDYVSSRTLKSGAGLEHLNKMTFGRARRMADRRLTEWRYEKDRQGYVRCPF
jgi:hypothetical protein